MIILLDIDGVLVTTPGWRSAELLADGFLKFNEKAAKNLAHIIDRTRASIVLTSTHRISYSIPEWHQLLRTRGIYSTSISKLNDRSSLAEMGNRAVEIEDWVNTHPGLESFVVIDDDPSINGLPARIKDRCVLTKPMIGLDDESTTKVLGILLGK